MYNMNIDIEDYNLKFKIISLIINNALNLGWNVEQTKNNVFVLRKKKDQLTVNEQSTEMMLDNLFMNVN
ncbi:hypothetical protein BMW23_0525 [Bodo saltans virus]|uniref:Uncharacterized protein n=1 Tax=Bodo saltans virus TaxID=2024608 RepID=A0A2H4UUH3_9VIRU|nr:hypothetical protein QJ851_gp0509 [Bodo saltans virus]ATZ80572.1 hypothetical protein BMW23_0525 [Bodo saltans virus]